MKRSVAREVTTWLGRIFAERKQTGSLDLEAVEMGLRTIPCPCGDEAHYRELRSRRILTALGEVELSRPWYLCPHCHDGQFPVDRQLDIENRDCSPGVRRMQAMVGQEAPFDHGREQMKVLAGLEVTTKVGGAHGGGDWRRHRRRRAARNPQSRATGSARHHRRADSRFCMCRWTGPACRW